jgi:hypothetical protein
MNCVDWEERIALYAGGDLAPAEAPPVERHVAECTACRVLLSGLRESLSLVREAHGEPVDAAHFAAVRARVLAELEDGPARRWRLGWVYAMAAAAAVLLVFAWPRQAKKSVALAPVPAAKFAGSGAGTVVRGGPPGPALRHSRVLREAHARGPGSPLRTKGPAPPNPDHPGEPMVVKLLTSDPDVVIYWITGTKGE